MPQTRDSVFDRIAVTYSVAGTTRVEWSLHPDFNDEWPWSFQLQVNKNIDEPGEWYDVGGLVTDTYYAEDTTQRLWGMTPNIGYRVILTTSNGTYTSPVAHIYGKLTRKQWLLARAILRRARLLVNRPYYKQFDGYLLKRRWFGQRCSCVDIYTEGIKNTNCAQCYGTGRTGGYWRPESVTVIDMKPTPITLQVDQNLVLGTVGETARICRFIGFPIVSPQDVWVDANSDVRYLITKAEVQAELNAVPLIVDAELHVLPYSDVRYKIPISE